METHLKRIGQNHQEVWGHNHECVRAQWKCTLAEDCNSFEMQRMTVRTEQLLHIAEAAGSRIHARESEAETYGRVRNMVLTLKQYHAHCCWFFEKGTTITKMALG